MDGEGGEEEVVGGRGGKEVIEEGERVGEGERIGEGKRGRTTDAAVEVGLGFCIPGKRREKSRGGGGVRLVEREEG